MVNIVKESNNVHIYYKMQILQLYQANAITLQTLKAFIANVDL